MHTWVKAALDQKILQALGRVKTPMLDNSTKALLWRLIRSLENANEAAWEDRLELGKQCLFEISQMTRGANGVLMGHGAC
jgi:hypothetical protein